MSVRSSIRASRLAPLAGILALVAFPAAADTSEATDPAEVYRALLESPSLAERMEVGTAWVNQHRATSAYVPFGGAKQSGLGRQYSILGLKGYMEPQVVSVSKL